MRINYKDVSAGVFFVAVGLFFCLNAWAKLTVGTAFRMGPGYFPILLGGILTLLGLAIVARSAFIDSGAIGEVSPRGVVLIGLAPVIFGATVQGLGLVGAVALSTLVAALSSRQVRLPFALALTACLTAFCILVFHYGLGLPIQLFGPWIAWGR